MNNDLDILNSKYMEIQTIEFFYDIFKQNPNIKYGELINILFKDDGKEHKFLSDIVIPEFVYMSYDFFKPNKILFNWLFQHINQIEIIIYLNETPEVDFQITTYDYYDFTKTIHQCSNVMGEPISHDGFSTRYHLKLEHFIYQNKMFITPQYKVWKNYALTFCTDEHDKLGKISSSGNNKFIIFKEDINKMLLDKFFNIHDIISYKEIYELKPAFWKLIQYYTRYGFVAWQPFGTVSKKTRKIMDTKNMKFENYLYYIYSAMKEHPDKP